ncbi:MAG: AI-2E family transporter [Dethiobacter sp.]|jgi:predicted PurR-regulated permease PerM|nr:MAG: AI-2E family transporter [Dethiobacter sp.]
MDAELKANIKLVLFIFSLILGLWLLRIIFPVISLVIVALLVVYLILPLVEILVKFHIPQAVASVIIFILFIFIILLTSYFVPPLIFREIRSLAIYIATDFRQYVILLFKQLEQIDLLLGMNLSQILISTIISHIESIPLYLLQWINRISSFNIPFLSEIWSLLGLFFLILFLLFDINGVKTALVNLFPSHYRKEAAHVIRVTDDKVGAYLRGNLVRCSIVGLATGLGLFTIGMPFVLILGITAGLLNIIYKIGPFLAAIPAILISFTPGAPHPALVIALYLVIQLIDAFILTHFLMGKAVDLRPVTIVFAILCGARLLGLLGIILAIPLTAIIKVLLNHYYISRMDRVNAAEESGFTEESRQATRAE